ncbi:bifunctional hydroxymethylpyrimidine kinase/phosphomethylpyrimidine kinase [Sphaerotilus sp.]|uniref:bifunctional hydroxymethylpyrimidine kinase/phosphomethylpyrimidine kinase n=1 Tax=Sphaerotilus sp. TaxID=2093942 RepID=UPI0025E82601|nr:bifunctional hydroxymethylpyrimidine kinase/phosphomethylpyrimidine kinase [Sphaerotilus sp.]
MTHPIVWSVAGNDSGGGAGLSADARAAEGCAVHLCPVVASITAQNSLGVQCVVPVAPEVLGAQLAALADDLRPAVIKTGLIGSVDGVAVLARWLRRFDADGGTRVRLVIDPVLGASAGGAAFADAALIDAYRTHLLPRADLVTPNRREAARLLGVPEAATLAEVPAQAAALRALGAAAVCITGGDSVDGADALDWLDTPHARGWLALPRLDVRHTHGTGCTFATTAAAAMARGFVTADALVLAKMATTAGLAIGHAAGQGVGPVGFDAGFASEARWLPRLGCDETPVSGTSGAALPWPSGLYAIVDAAAQAEPLLAAAEPLLCALQLRIKRVAHAVLDDRAFAAEVCAQIDWTLARAAPLPAEARPVIVVNDHHALVLDAIDAGTIDPADIALHLGQEDVLALGADGRARLAAVQARGLRLGVSSHSLWELCRAAALAPSYVACGPVWATTTKDMPWHPQGLHNLRWWAAMAPVPVVGIGGLLVTAQVEAVAGSGAACACLVRALATRPGESEPVAERLAAAVAAWRCGVAAVKQSAPDWPRPSLGPSIA